MRPRLLTTVLSSLFLFLTPYLRAADVQWPAKLGNWTASGPANPTPVTSADQRPDPVLLEAGMVGLASRNYQDGDQLHHLHLYVFHDSSGAYEGYTLLRGTEAKMNGDHAIILKSNLVLWVDGNPGPSALGPIEAWVQSVSDGVTSPPVARYLPDRGREAFTERYALGPLGFVEAAKAVGRADAAALVDQAGFHSGAEAMFARYKNGKDEATLLLIEYPTPQLAELHLKHMQRALLGLKNGASVERKGSLLSIVFAPTSLEYAEKLRSAVNYETQVTWSEPSTTATDPPIMSTLVKIFIATGVFMVVTVVVGIAFGGVRIITKRLFPGKVFDRKNQIEVLQLGLSSKPIDPTDMY